jgi:hypothetical protein
LQRNQKPSGWSSVVPTDVCGLSSRASLHEMLERLQAHTEEKKIGATRVIIEVDPLSLL